MAREINSAGSQLFQRNLAEYNDERNKDDRTQQAEGQRLGRQLTSLGMDPDVNDPRLAKLGMAASMAPSGILGTVIKGIAQVKGMDAMQVKADAGKEHNERMADMIRSNFEEMSEEDAMMYASNPKAFEQFQSVTNYSNAQADRQKKNEREDEAYSEQQSIKENFKNLQEHYAETFETIFEVEPEVARMMAADPNTAHSNMQRIWDTKLDENAKKTLWEQYKEQIIESTGVTSFDQFKVMDEMPVALMNDMIRRGGAKKYIGYNDDLLDLRTGLENQYSTQRQIADAVAIDSMYTDQQAIDYGQVKNPRMMVDKSMIPDLKRELYSKFSSGENAKEVTSRYDKIVSGQLVGLQKKISRNNQDLLGLHKRFPSLATGPIAIGSAGYLKESLPTYRPGTFFQSNNANFRVVDDGQGNNISKAELEWNDEDKLQFQNRYGLDYGVTGPGASIATPPAPGSNSLGLPDNRAINVEVNALSKEETEAKMEKQKTQQILNRIGTAGSRAVAREKEELLSKQDNFQNGVQNMVDLSSKETGVSANVFNFDIKTIGDSNQMGTLISNGGKQVNIGGLFTSPDDGYAGYMNYKQMRGLKNKKLLFSKPILISEFIEKINGPDAEGELGLTSKQVKDYKKLINSANSKSDKLDSLGYGDGNYPDLKNMENMLKPDSSSSDVNPDVVEEVAPASKSGETKSIEEVIKGIDSLMVDVKKKSNAQEQVRPLDEVVSGLDEYLENIRKGN